MLGAVVFNKAYSKCGAIFSQIRLNPVLNIVLLNILISMLTGSLC